MVCFVNTKQMPQHNVIFNKTVTKTVAILTKCFFSHIWTLQAILTHLLVTFFALFHPNWNQILALKAHPNTKLFKTTISILIN